MPLNHEVLDDIPRYRRGRDGGRPEKSHTDTISCGRRGASTAVLRLGLLLLAGCVGGGEGWLAAGGAGGVLTAGRGSDAMALQSTSRMLGLGEREECCCDLVFSATYGAILPF